MQLQNKRHIFNLFIFKKIFLKIKDNEIQKFDRGKQDITGL